MTILSDTNLVKEAAKAPPMIGPKIKAGRYFQVEVSVANDTTTTLDIPTAGFSTAPL